MQYIIHSFPFTERFQHGTFCEEGLRSLLYQRLSIALVERNEGDLDLQVRRLLGSSTSAALQEFISFMMYFASNSMLSLAQRETALEWTTYLHHQAFRRQLFGMKSTTVRAFLDCMLQTAVETNNPQAGITLLRADLDGILFAGRRDELARMRLQFEQLLSTQGKWPYVLIPHLDGYHAKSRLFQRACAIIQGSAYRDKDKYILTKAARGTGVTQVLALLGAGNNLHKIICEWPRSVLVDAIKLDNPEVVKALVEAGATCEDLIWNIGGTKSATDLQLAAGIGSIDIVRVLISSLSIANPISSLSEASSWLAIRAACKFGHIDVVRQLIAFRGNSFQADINKLGYDINAHPDGRKFPTTVLVAAVEGGHTSIARLLISHGVNTNAESYSDYGSNALEVAKVLEHREIECLIIGAGIDDNIWSGLLALNGHRTVELLAAVRRDDFRRIRALISMGIDPYELFTGFDSPNCFDANNIKDIQRRLQVYLHIVGGAVHADRKSLYFSNAPFLAAILVRDLETARVFIHRGASVDPYMNPNFGHTTLLQLHLSVEPFPNQATIEIADLMLQKGARVNALPGVGVRNGTALQIAALRNSLDLVKLLVDAGADINAPPSYGEYGHTALQAAVHAVEAYTTGLDTDDAAELRIVNYLFSKGADVNAKPGKNFGRTALQMAVSATNPNLDLIQILLDKGADINAPAGEQKGITALQGAAILGHMKVAYMLLQLGADVNASGSSVNGRTALQGAAEWGRLDMVQLLLDAEAKPSESAVELAQKEGHYVIAELISKRLEDTDTDMNLDGAFH